jgi:hypothetical protein
MMRAVAVALLSGAFMMSGCGGKSRPTEVIIHQHGKEKLPMTIDTSQVPKEWMVGWTLRERDVIGWHDRKQTVELRPGHRLKVVILPDHTNPGELP